jgi:hypothetical protein
MLPRSVRRALPYRNGLRIVFGFVEREQSLRVVFCDKIFSGTEFIRSGIEHSE